MSGNIRPRKPSFTLAQPASSKKRPNIGKTPVNRPLSVKLAPCNLSARIIMAFGFSNAELLVKYHHSLSVRRIVANGIDYGELL